MAVAVANTNQYLYKRNFNENKWAAVGEKTCKVQVTEKSGEFYFKIYDGVEKKEFRLSQESRLHLSNGFIQVPIAENKALYGIKFSKPEEAETFYGKVVSKMGQTWNDQRTGVDADNLPKPYSMFDVGSGKHAPPSNAVPRSEVPQSLPVKRSPPLVQKAPQAAMFNSSQPGRELLPEANQRPLRAGAGEGGGSRGYVPPGGGTGGREIPGAARYDMGRQDVMGHGTYNGGHTGSPGGRYDEHRFGGTGGFAVGPNNRGYGPGVGGPSGGFPSGPPVDYNRRGGNPYVDAGGYNGGGRVSPGYDGRYGGGVDQRRERGGGPGYHVQEGHYHGGGGMYGGGPPPQRRENPPAPRRAWEPNEHPPNARPLNPQPARPPHVKPADLPSVVDSLSNAFNKRNKQQALDMLEAFFSVDAKCGKVNMMLQDLAMSGQAEEKEENKFVLHIKVEFQQPEKKPLVIFLEDVQATDTVDVLKTMVQVKFFIPKASQNWIIGENLVTSNDLQKSLKDLGITGELISEVKVFMYVMHPKKANVPKEDFEGIRARQMQLRKQQQGQMGQPEFLGQPSIPDQSNFARHGGGGGGGGGYVQADSRGDPIYNTLGNRGYTGDPPYASDHPPQRVVNSHQQYSMGPGDPVYSHISMHGDGSRGDLVTRAPPPNTGYAGRENGPVYSRASDSNQLLQTVSPPHQSRPSPPGAVRVMPTSIRLPPSMAPSLSMSATAPPPPSLKPEKEVGWSCAACTMFNPPHRPSCEACLADRPEDYVVPEDAPLDEATRKALESEKDFEEYQRQEKIREANEARENYRQYLDTDAGEAVPNTQEFECQVCFGLIPPGDGLVLRGCLHEFCKDCLRGSVVNSNEPEIKCPFDNGDYVCGAVISEREVKAVVSEEELAALYQRGLRQAENAAPNSFHCRTANCDSFCFYEDEVNEFNCPVCRKKNCILCKAIHEDMNCQEYQDDLKRRAANDEAAQQTQKMLEDLVEKGEAMNCPQCKIIVQKKDGCDWIRCVMCKTEICWATKQRRWGPQGKGDTSGGCRCRVGGKKCHPLCRNCH